MQVLNASGKYETVHTFEEAFPHHVNYVMMVATGEVAACIGTKPRFRTYVRGHEPRATFPHREIQHRIAECIAELIAEAQMARRTALRKEFGGLPHQGWQIDMWTVMRGGNCIVRGPGDQ